MQPVPFQRHRFPPDVIRLAVWLYFRFTLSFREVEEMLAQRGDLVPLFDDRLELDSADFSGPQHGR